jgi:glutamate N-acetyltransferase/amino-acid N-acetyltransferase
MDERMGRAANETGGESRSAGAITNLLVPRGFRAAGLRAGLKPSGALDLAILCGDGPCAAAGTFTTNRVCAAPVKWSRGLLPAEDIRAVLINAGNANAATGRQGLSNVEKAAAHAASLLGCEPRQVLVASTGVIGVQLPMKPLLDGIDRAVAGLSHDPESFRTAATAIMTTDTRPKIASERLAIGDREVTLLGVAKGAAMIGPRMATMLGFLLTDAPVWASDLRDILVDAVDASFHCLTVEGHASTNDTVLLLSSTAATEPILRGDDLTAFAEMVKFACTALARSIADDGEGATHLISIDVTGCHSLADARQIARSVAEDNLVKAAVHGADPNWGRIVSAAGHAGVPFDEENLSVAINQVTVYQAGVPVPFDAPALSRSIKGRRECHLQLALDRGHARVRFWTCDLTAEYVRLNADYTT